MCPAVEAIQMRYVVPLNTEKQTAKPCCIPFSCILFCGRLHALSCGALTVTDCWPKVQSQAIEAFKISQ